MQKIHVDYYSHILRYVGVGLISGSLVHAGTLGGSATKYIILVIMGIAAFTLGTYLENRSTASRLSFLVLSVIVSVGTGMIGGGIQHYLDGPIYASFLIPLGIVISYVAFRYREDTSIPMRNLLWVIAIALLCFGSLYTTAHYIHPAADHHDQDE